MVKEKRISKALIPGTTTVGEGGPVFDLMRGRAGHLLLQAEHTSALGLQPSRKLYVDGFKP